VVAGRPRQAALCRACAVQAPLAAAALLPACAEAARLVGSLEARLGRSAVHAGLVLPQRCTAIPSLPS
jgi:hypothetical protein